MNRDRLTVLRDYLRSPAVDPAAFNIAFWWRTSAPWSNTECGYAGCAVGHACRIPEFNAAGFGLTAEDGGESFPTFDGVHSDDAVARFFGLTDDQVHHLFYGSSYPRLRAGVSQYAVANRIDEFLNAAAPDAPAH